MSTQKFSTITRQAIWLAYGKKCVYTGELIMAANLQIDHIIPEKLANDPLAFDELKKRLSLSDQFDINGFENLLPTNQGVNSQKKDTVFPDSKLVYFLAIAQGKKEKIDQLIAGMKTEFERSAIMLKLQAGIENNLISIEEVADMLENYQTQSEAAFELMVSLQFIDKKNVDFVRKSDIKDLRQVPIRIGFNENIFGVELVNESDKSLFIQTCQAYDDAIQQGYFARTTFDIKMASFFEQHCGLLNALEGASIPENSFLRHPKVGVMDLHLMPFSIFPTMESNPEIINSIASYQDKINDGILQIVQVRSNFIHIRSSLMGQQLLEVARADFNGDGIEDILLYQHEYAVGGTYGSGSIFILTRLTANGRFVLLR